METSNMKERISPEKIEAQIQLFSVRTAKCSSMIFSIMSHDIVVMVCRWPSAIECRRNPSCAWNGLECCDEWRKLLVWPERG